MSNNISCRAAALIIQDNKLLFAKNVNHPCYYIVGGGIEENETSEEAVIREVFEETGLRLEVKGLVMIQERFYEVGRNKHHEIVFFYLMKCKGYIDVLDNSFSDQGTEETLLWLPISGLEEFNIIPEFLKTKSFYNMTGIEHIVIREY